MASFKVISTGSKGNAYALEVEDEILLIECGVKWKDVLKAIDYRAGNVVGAIVSHAHTDHLGFRKQYADYGVRIHTPFEAEGAKANTRMGGFQIASFDLPHDGTPCCGFVIYHPKMGQLAYLTDFEYCKYTFPGINYLVVECNYMDSFVEDTDNNFNHRLRGHASLTTCHDFVASNLNPKLKKVILIHASETALDKVKAIGTVREAFKDTVMAEKGLTVELKGEEKV